ncbi:GyrI-like domain-containing protein [Nocardia carnea]|uniref:GyrI-like domain-containing protein n=1 Tax=Nocardia carnea TaxID=37328 RepID=A0ABW7THL5_9NOCA|nr:GyrI-like domain-containing protein [Nocardia carnea]
MRYRVSLGESGPHTVLAVLRTVRTDRAGDDIGNGMAELHELARELRLTPVGPPRTTYHGDFRPGSTTEVEFEVPVTGPAGDTGTDFTLHHADRQSYAHTYHRGNYAGVGAAYRAIDDWIRDSGRHAVGPPTEIYHVAPDETVAPAELLTEIQVPVTSVVLAVRVRGFFDTIVGTTHEVLRDQGFEIAGEWDVRKTLTGPSDTRSDGYLIIDAYHPGLAHSMMAAAGRLAPLLPCSVTLRGDRAHTVIETIDPDLLWKQGGLAELEPLVPEIRERLELLLRAVERRCAQNDEAPERPTRVPTQP